MPSPRWNDDDELVRDLSRALQVPAVQVPAVNERILTAAAAAFAWRTVDVDLELAQLLYDSYLGEQVLVRGQVSKSPRSLAFEGEHLGVEIEVTNTGIEGQLVPPQPGAVTLVTPAGTHATAPADSIGCFAVPSPPRGSIRLECSTGDGSCTTEWITI